MKVTNTVRNFFRDIFSYAYVNISGVDVLFLILLSRLFFLTSYTLDNDEILAFRMLDNFHEYFIKDIHLFIYDYVITGIGSFLFGSNILVFRVLNLLFFFFSVIIMREIIRERLSRKSAFVFSVISLFSPFLIYYSIYIESYTFSLFINTIIIRFFILSKVKDNIGKIVLLTLISGYTHYFNIVFLFIYYCLNVRINKISSKDIIKIFSLFLPLFILITYKYIIGMDNSELFDFNISGLSDFSSRNLFSSVFYLLSGSVFSAESIFIPVVLYSIFSLIYFLRRKDKDISLLGITAFLYFFVISLTSCYADMKFGARSFSNDYIVLISFILYIPICSLFSVRKAGLSVILLIMVYCFNAFSFYSYIKKINQEYFFLKDFIFRNNSVFYVFEDAVSERNTKEFVSIIFGKEAKFFGENVSENSSIIIPFYFSKEITYNIDDKIDNGKARNIAYIIRESDVIRKFTGNMKFEFDIRIGKDNYMVFSRNKDENK